MNTQHIVYAENETCCIAQCKTSKYTLYFMYICVLFCMYLVIVYIITWKSCGGGGGGGGGHGKACCRMYMVGKTSFRQVCYRYSYFILNVYTRYIYTRTYRHQTRKYNLTQSPAKYRWKYNYRPFCQGRWCVFSLIYCTHI